MEQGLEVASALDGHAQHFGIARLRQKLVRDRDHSQGGGKLGVVRENNTHDLRISVAHAGQQCGSVHSRHAQVRDNNIER
jgi:hypothetical protein